MSISRTSVRISSVALAVAFLFSFAPQAFASSPVVHISHNWAGYGVSGGTYTGVTGTWTVPDSLPTSWKVSADAAWVGIGGLSTKDLIQAGTQTVFVNGRAEHQAWYETLPDAQQVIPFAIAAGDTVTVTLEEQRAGVWHLTFVNHTAGTTYAQDIPYASSHASAEWVLERPLAVTSAGTGYVPLNAFGTMQFSGASVTENGRHVSLADSGAEPLYMSNDEFLLATASEAQGGQFSVRYLAPYEGRIAMRDLLRAYRTVAPTAQPARVPVTTVDTQANTVIIRIVF